jgi:hypothetical protein
VLGATPLGQAAGERLADVVPFAKTAGNAQKLNGHRSALSGSPGTIPVVGKDGKLPEAIGAVGPQGPQGPQGEQGPKGEQGPAGVTGSAGGGLTGTYPNPQIASNAVGSAQVADDSLTGSDVKEATLGQVPSALLGGLGRTSPQKSCDPESSRFVICNSVLLDLPARTRVLVIAHALAVPDFDASEGLGDCEIATSATNLLSDTFNRYSVRNQAAVTLVTVTPVLGPGPVSFSLDCTQQPVGAIQYFYAAVTAIAISAN